MSSVNVASVRDVTERLQDILDAIEHVERYAARGQENFKDKVESGLRSAEDSAHFGERGARIILRRTSRFSSATSSNSPLPLFSPLAISFRSSPSR